MEKRVGYLMQSYQTYDPDEAAAFVWQGFSVFVIHPDGELTPMESVSEVMENEGHLFAITSKQKG
jgi:hypothetical protein